MTPSPALRVLVTNDRLDRLFLLVDILSDLGHDVIAQQLTAADVAAATADVLPDVVLVGLGAGTAATPLDRLTEITHHATCPVIALLDPADASSIDEAARRGLAAAILWQQPEELRDAIETQLERLADYRKLRQAMSRRATIERATDLLITRREEQTLDGSDSGARDARRGR